MLDIHTPYDHYKTHKNHYNHQPGIHIQNFKNKLEKNKINVTIRREMGRDIDGACGQLRRSYISNDKAEE